MRLQTRAPLRDLLSLTKPRLSGLVVVTSGGGILLAPGLIAPWRAIVTMVATALVVGGANSLNCYLERDLDGRMARTRDRPLPAGRLPARTALALGIVLSVVALPVLAVASNVLTALLALTALVVYVAIYTPLKQLSPLALWAGALPGALPPLMGWTAVRGRIEVPGLVLFAILFCWQIPHFIAIAIHRSDEYLHAGHKILPLQVGPIAVRLHATVWTAILVPVSMLPAPLGIVHPWCFPAAGTLGLLFLAWTASGFAHTDEQATQRWARRLFVASLVYLNALFVVLVAGRNA